MKQGDRVLGSSRRLDIGGEVYELYGWKDEIKGLDALAPWLAC